MLALRSSSSSLDAEPAPRRPSRSGLLWRAIAGLVLGAAAVVLAVEATDQGWPLAATDDELAAAAGLVLFLGLPLRTAGWRRLIAGDRPGQADLLAANGAAYLSGAVLPSQLHHVVKAAVLRRLAPGELRLETIAVSLVTLSLLDAAALVPLTLAGAATAPSEPVRGALALAALVGVGAGALLLGVGPLVARLRRGRPRWLRGFGRAASRSLVGARDLRIAVALLLGFWVARACGVLLLLDAMGLGGSFELAVVLVALSASAAALPLGLLGSAAQVGTVAAVLVAAGADPGRAVGFGLALTMLVLLAACALALLALGWRWRRRTVGAAEPLVH